MQTGYSVFEKNKKLQKGVFAMRDQCCGTCAFNKPEYCDVFVCDNEESDYYGLETEYNECCPDYEEKDECE